MISWSRRGFLVLLCKQIFRLFCVKTMRRWQFLVQLGENTTLVGSDCCWLSTDLYLCSSEFKIAAHSNQ